MSTRPQLVEEGTSSRANDRFPGPEALDRPPTAAVRRRWRLIFGVLVTATLSCFGFGLWVHWPWLEIEHHRLDPVCRILIWAGEGSAVLWCAWCGVRYVLLGDTLPGQAVRDWEFRYAVLSLVGAWLLDLGITGYAFYNVKSARSHSEKVRGEIVAARLTDNKHKADVTYRYRDTAGTWHESCQRVNLGLQQPAWRDAILNGPFPVGAQVSYDTRWPERSWVQGLYYTLDEQLFGMSFACLLFQGMATMPAIGLRKLPLRYGYNALYKLVPLWGTLFPFFVGAVALYLEGSR